MKKKAAFENATPTTQKTVMPKLKIIIPILYLITS